MPLASGVAGQGEEGPPNWGTYNPNLGFKVADTEHGDLSISLFTYARYLNQRALEPTYTSYFGVTTPVQQRQDFQLNAMTYAFTSLAETAACYDACMRLAQVYRRVLPLPLIEVRHEALVEDFDKVLAEIAVFLGLEVTPEMADFAATASRRSVRTPSAPQVRAGLNRRGIGRWRAYERQLAPVLPLLAPWAEKFGYRVG